MIKIKSNIFVPEKINIGFQNRNDTYTKKLAYIIYFDQKGVLRKERSWQSWRDNKIPNIIKDNTPTSGFVLNKKAGGYDTGWNHRQTYVRVYDPRDFEFEISVPNLLFILENATSTKGKGLEGEFVYGWDGTELVLLPVDSPDYVEISAFNKVLHAKQHIKSKELILGATYRTKQDEEWIYLGRFDYYDTKSERIEDTSRGFRYGGCYKYNSKVVNKGKYYWFIPKDANGAYFNQVKSLGDKFIEVVDTNCVYNYAELIDKMECNCHYSPIDKSKDEYIPYTFEEFSTKLDEKTWFNCYNTEKKRFEVSGMYNQNGLYFCREINNYSNRIDDCTKKTIFDIVKPMYLNTYLENGKLYSGGF